MYQLKWKYRHIHFLVGGCILSCVCMFMSKMIYEAVTNSWLEVWILASVLYSLPAPLKASHPSCPRWQIPPSPTSHRHKHAIVKPTSIYVWIIYLPDSFKHNQSLGLAQQMDTLREEMQRGDREENDRERRYWKMRNMEVARAEKNETKEVVEDTDGGTELADNSGRDVEKIVVMVMRECSFQPRNNNPPAL